MEESATSKSTEVGNIAAYLPRVAAEQPYSPAIFFPDGRDSSGRVRYTHFTYAQLDEASDRVAHGLYSEGVRRGTRTAMMVTPSLDLFTLVFALFKLGAVPVLVDPGLGLKNIKGCLARARPEAFIGVAKAQLARVGFGWARRTIRTVVTVGRRIPAVGGVTLDEVANNGRGRGAYLEATSSDEIAAILFTSGSTGPPKGAVYTHGNFIAQVGAIRDMYDIQPGEIDLPTLPLFALFDPALGMTTIIPDMDPTKPAEAEPEKLIEAIEDFGVTNMFGSPALLNRLSRAGVQKNVRLPSLRRVISAGAPVPTSTLQRMRRLLNDDALIVTPYGATECLPVSSIESREVIDDTSRKTITGAGVCVGKPVDDVEVQVIEVTDGPLRRWSDATVVPSGEIGEIVVRGPMASRRYWNDAGATHRAKIRDDEGDGFRHRMGDVGYFDHYGRLWYCGRKSQRVRTAQGTLYTVACERIFDAHPDVYRSALVGVRQSGTELPVICIELESGFRESNETLLYADLRGMAKRNAQTQAIEHFLIHPGFPVDIRHNAKINREALARWASEQIRT